MEKDLPLTIKAIEELKNTLDAKKQENIEKIDEMIKKIKEAL